MIVIMSGFAGGDLEDYTEAVIYGGDDGDNYDEVKKRRSVM